MGLTKPRAAQIYNLDYKQATRVITTTDITLSGGAPNSVDGVNLALNDRVLVIGQYTGSQNGIYKVTSLGAGSNGTWTRTTDADATGEIEAGMIIMVTEGNIYADTQWKLTTNDPIVIGTTSLTFVINILSSVGGSNTQVQFNDGGTLAGSSALTFDKSTNILSVNGNISGNYYIGNGSQLTGISSSGGSSISNGTSNVNVVSSGGNVTVGVGGTPDVAVFATTGGYINGVLSVSGNITSAANITGGNLLTGGLISANGTVTASSLLGSVVSAIANVTGGNVLTGGIISATGNVTGGNVLTVGLISATSTVTGSSLLGSVVSATANITGGNLLTGGLISATANITGGNLNASGLSLTGTVSSNLIPIANITYSLGNSTNRWKDLFLSGNTIILGDANLSTSGSDFSVSGNISSPANIYGANIIASANIDSGNANITTQINTTSVSASGNIRTAGTVSSTGTVTSSSLLGTVVSASANITGGNVLTVGLMSATSTITSAANITGGNLLTGGLISATGNITGGNINTGGLISATSTIISAANVTGGNLLTVGLVSASGSITGTSHIGSVVSVTANITGGNVLTSGLVSATGNISADYFIGNGSLLTGISGSGNYSNANVAAYLPTYPGNLVSLTGPVTTTGNITGDYIYGNGYYLTGILGGTNIAPLAGTVDNFTGNGVQTNFTLSTTPTSVNLIFVNVNGVYQLPSAYSLSTNVLTMTSAVPNGAVLSVTQLSGGGIANSLVNGSSNIVVAANSNISMSAAGTANVVVVASNGLYLTGTITVNTGNAATAIINGAANGVGNIGSSTTYFDTVFAKATSAQYADLAEMYVSDFGYVPGTVVVFGGEQEVTLATTTDDHRVAGVVSTNPSYLMNSIQQGEYVIPVALTGRVPCKVTGTIRKGDLMVTAGNGHAYANNRAQSGTIIGKALENHSGESGVIEVVVGTR